MFAIVAVQQQAPRRARASRCVQALTVLALSSPLLAGCAWLDRKQRQLALRPTPSPLVSGPAAQVARRPGEVHYALPLPADAAQTERLALWWLPQADPAAPALLYLHGTFRNLAQNRSKIEAIHDAGFAVLAVDYRGWGDSTTLLPSEDSITADAALAWAELQQRQPDPRRRVIFGHSMGGAVAVRLASGLHCASDYAGLMLESTFTRLPDVAAAAGGWGRLAGMLTTLRFDSLSRVARIDAPLLMLHGDADRTVPIEVGRRLRDAAGPRARWTEVPAGSHSRLHEDAPQVYRQVLRGLLATTATPACRSSAGPAPAPAPPS